MTDNELRIERIRKATDTETPDWWTTRFGNPTVLELSDGSVVFAAKDPELNDAGHMLLYDDGNYFDLEPEGE